jgi:hypothetical protein
MCNLASIYCSLGRFQDALELAQHGLRVHQAAAKPSFQGIQNCQVLIHQIKQRKKQGI